MKFAGKGEKGYFSLKSEKGYFKISHPILVIVQ